MAYRWLMRDTAYYNNRIVSTSNVSSGTATKYDFTGLTLLNSITNIDDGSATFMIPFDFYFYNTNYGNGNNGGVYWTTNNVLQFGTGTSTITWAANTGKGILMGNYDRRTNSFYYGSTMITSSNPTGYNIQKCICSYQNVYNDGGQNGCELQFRIIKGAMINSNQYVEIRINKAAQTKGNFNITNGTSFLYGTNVDYNGFSGQINKSCVLESNSTGTIWTFYNDSYMNIT